MCLKRVLTAPESHPTRLFRISRGWAEKLTLQVSAGLASETDKTQTPSNGALSQLTRPAGA